MEEQNQFQTQNQGEQPVGIGNWIGSLFVVCIPIVGFIMLIVWAASHPNKTKKNWAIAQIIIMIMGVVLFFLFGTTLVALLSNL